MHYSPLNQRGNQTQNSIESTIVSHLRNIESMPSPLDHRLTHHTSIITIGGGRYQPARRSGTKQLFFDSYTHDSDPKVEEKKPYEESQSQSQLYAISNDVRVFLYHGLGSRRWA